MSICILQGGAFSTIQDIGRYGGQSMGFSVSGVMDRKSFWQANMLLGKKQGGAVIESALCGPTLKFTESVYFTLTGADMQPLLNGRAIPQYHVFLAKPGDELRLGFAEEGMYTYIAFAAKIDVPDFMGSRSTNLKCGVGGYQGRKLEAGDELPLTEVKENLPNLYKRYEDISLKMAPEITLRAMEGPEYDRFGQTGAKTFWNSVYTVSDAADRMGYRMEGEPVTAEGGVDIISNGIAFGAVQIPPNGMPIIMMADRQTMGGYAKIANVISADLPLLAQSRPGMKVRFCRVTVEEAQKALYRERRLLKHFWREVN